MAKVLTAFVSDLTLSPPMPIVVDARVSKHDRDVPHATRHKRTRPCSVVRHRLRSSSSALNNKSADTLTQAHAIVTSTHDTPRPVPHAT